MNKPTKSRVAAHAERQRAKGLRKVQVWVPSGLEDKIRLLAQKLREKHLTGRLR